MPLALKGLMEPNTRMTIKRACRVFRRICFKVWDSQLAKNLREDVALTMCFMDITFPLTFFDVMSHLPLYLVDEIMILGLAQVRWM